MARGDSLLLHGQCSTLKSPFEQQCTNSKQVAAHVPPCAAPAQSQVHEPFQSGADTPSHRALGDDGKFNASLDFVRPSAAILPGSAIMRRKTMLPLGFVLQPLAASGEEQVEILDPDSSGMIERCSSCHAYLNPYVQFEDRGRTWVCNFCKSKRRLGSLQNPDSFTRPMQSGSVEYIVRDDDTVRAQSSVAFVFVIEVSHAAVASGFLRAVVASIKGIIQSDELPGGAHRQIGVITYDSSLHFYDLSPQLQQPRMCIMPELEEPFQPLSSVLFRLTDSESLFVTLMDSIPAMFGSTTVHASCMGSAIKAAGRALAHTCGKIVVCATNPPSLGELSVPCSRESPDFLASEREVEFLRPASDDYTNVAAQLVREHKSVDLFIAPRHYIDLASLAPLATLTGGQVCLYREFQMQRDESNLARDMLRSLSRCTACQATMTVWVSVGWVVSRIYGNACVSGSSLTLPTCHEDQNFGVLVDMNAGVKPTNASEKQVFYIQSAILYTNSNSERRLRVHTYAVPCSVKFANIIGSVDAQVTATLLVHASIERALATGLPNARGELMAVARHVASARRVTGQECLQPLLLYIFSVLKSKAFSADGDVSADDRVHRWAWLAAATTGTKLAHLCPRLMALPRPEELCESVVAAPCLRLTSASLSQEGMYLLEDGQLITVWVGSALASDGLHELFGTTVTAPCSHMVELALRKPTTALARKIASVIEQVCLERRSPSMEISVIFAGDPAERRFRERLIEDRTPGYQVTYSEFLQNLGSTL